MSQENIVIIEDEPYNLRLLKRMIKKIRPNWQIIQTLETVKGSVEWLKNHTHPNLFFMDIQLADGLCFSIFNQVEINSMVIFTTAYDNYAIQAFKVNSIDYLLKPFKTKDLEFAIKKYEKLKKLATISKTKMHNYPEILNSIRNGEKKYRKRFLVSKGSTFYKLQVKDIAYFYSEKRITNAYTFNKLTYIINFSLDSLEDQLNPDYFFRANRQVMVNIHAVEKIENQFYGKLKVKLNPRFKNELVVSRLKSMAFKEWLSQ